MTPATEIAANVIAKELECKRNDPAPVGNGNTAHEKGSAATSSEVTGKQEDPQTAGPPRHTDAR